MFYEKRQSLDENGTSLVTYVPQEKTNYWGYGDAYYFAPKASYFGGIQAPQRCRTMIQKIHEAGMEVIMEIAFSAETSQELMMDCLWYWVSHYGVDGSICWVSLPDRTDHCVTAVSGTRFLL